MLNQFKAQAKASLFKDGDWDIDKVRRPFILWLTSIPLVQRKAGKNPTKDINQRFKTYPYDYNES